MDSKFLIKYQIGDSFLEKLNGRTKVLLWFSSIFLLMLSYDLRILIPSFLLHFFLFWTLKRREVFLKAVIGVVLFSNLFNIGLLYLYNPLIGSDMAARQTLLFEWTPYFVLSYETLIFFLARLLKVMGSLFLSLWFVLSITPSQLAEGLYKLGFSYRVGTIISLALRYVPDVLKDYQSIKEAMQLRGEELSTQKSSLLKRIARAAQLLIPLLLISFERVEVIASAMELRAYGRFKGRTYYVTQNDQKKDVWVNGFSVFQMVLFIMYLSWMIMGLAPKSALWLP